MFILSKKQIAKFHLHQMTGTSQRVSQPSRERARYQRNNVLLFFPTFLFWDGLILCVTLYGTKPCGFLQPVFFCINYSKTDTNNNYL